MGAPTIHPLPFDLARLRGLSARLAESHHRANYAGAVRRLGAIRAELAALDWKTAPAFRVNGLKREELIAANSMTLHELYFASLGGDGVLQPAGASAGLATGLVRDFGSIERWRSEFAALGAALAGGSGWALLSWSARESRLLNHWASDHGHLPAGATPILALDMYEHAYHLDFDADAGAYIAAFMDNVDWAAVAARYAAAVAAGSAPFAATIGEVLANAAAKRVDVRRRGAFEAAPDMIAGAVWRDPERVDEWAGEFAGADVVVYCMRGHEVGQSTAARLREAGVNARFLAGGIEAWKSDERPTQPR